MIKAKRNLMLQFRGSSTSGLLMFKIIERRKGCHLGQANDGKESFEQVKRDDL